MHNEYRHLTCACTRAHVQSPMSMVLTKHAALEDTSSDIRAQTPGDMQLQHLNQLDPGCWAAARGTGDGADDVSWQA